MFIEKGYKMSKIKKRNIVICTVVFIVLALVICYFVYGNTMMNIKDEKSINSYLSVDKNKPVTILSQNTYEDYAGILYTDPVDSNENVIHFVYVKKHKLYPNRYIVLGGGKSNTGETECSKAYEDGAEKPIFFIYGKGDSDNICSVFEIDSETFIPVNKLEEIVLPAEDYVIAKDYKLENNENQVMVFNGSLGVEDVESLLGL